MIKFGGSGTGELFALEVGSDKTVDVAPWLRTKGLDCYEYSFGRGARITESAARAIGEAFKACEIEISVHAPYFINLACDDDKVANNLQYFASTLKRLRWMGGDRCIFHPGTQMKYTRAEAMDKACARLAMVLEQAYKDGYSDMKLAVESMGKLSQLGDIDEVIRLCSMDRILLPGIDFGHQNSRTHGGIVTRDDYRRIFDKLVSALGYERVNGMHIHFSKQEYSAAGEVRHLTFADKVYGPEFLPLAEILLEFKLEPYIICESAGTQTLDALEMKSIYHSLCI